MQVFGPALALGVAGTCSVGLHTMKQPGLYRSPKAPDRIGAPATASPSPSKPFYFILMCFRLDESMSETSNSSFDPTAIFCFSPTQVTDDRILPPQPWCDSTPSFMPPSPSSH